VRLSNVHCSSSARQTPPLPHLRALHKLRLDPLRFPPEALLVLWVLAMPMWHAEMRRWRGFAHASVARAEAAKGVAETYESADTWAANAHARSRRLPAVAETLAVVGALAAAASPARRGTARGRGWNVPLSCQQYHRCGSHAQSCCSCSPHPRRQQSCRRRGARGTPGEQAPRSTHAAVPSAQLKRWRW